MFIRYNETNKYWEYDAGLARAGEGPWIILPIDYAQIYNPPTTANSFGYRFDTTLTAPPPSTNIRFNAAHPYTGVTKLFASSTATGGKNVKNFLMRVVKGSRLYVQQDDDNTKWGDFTLTADPIDGGSYVEFTVTGDVTGNAIANNALTTLVVMAEKATLPSNIAYTDRNNFFNQTQNIAGGLVLSGSGPAGGVYERNRGIGMGDWINYTPTFGTDIGSISIDSISTFRYMLIGKTIFISFWIGITLGTANTVQIIATMPAGFFSTDYSGSVGINYQSSFLIQSRPGDSNMYFFIDMTGTTKWPSGGQALSGTAIIQIVG